MATPAIAFPVWAWFVFGAGLLACVAVDLILHRGARLRSHAAAITWTGLWVGVGLGFAFVVWGVLGGRRAWEYVTRLFAFSPVTRKMNYPAMPWKA